LAALFVIGGGAGVAVNLATAFLWKRPRPDIGLAGLALFSLGRLIGDLESAARLQAGMIGLLLCVIMISQFVEGWRGRAVAREELS
jgi:hypothetical protein